MPAYTFVDRPNQIASQLDNLERIGVDTEFMRERTFFAQLCLVQIATADVIYCADPLTEADMAVFWDSLCGCNWVLHSARQDIEVIYQTAGRMPVAIFDTQIAAGLLGHPPQMGYGSLVSELFKVELPKSHTRANWATRPLSEKFLEYAAEDVEYLLPSHEVLAERLDKKGRLGWAEADAALLLDSSLYDVDPANAIARLKGAAKFRGRRRAVAIRLAEWRESEALRRDRPRQWILRDSVLVDMAYRMPSTLDELAGIDDMPAKVIKRAGESILAAIANGNATKPEENGDYRPPSPPDEAQRSLLKQMQQVVAECATDLDIAAETIASKKELSAVILGGNRNSRVFDGWRRELIGDRLASLL
ncbi:MAG: ribonuclease D [Gammaproteobacteria bacterium]|nr:ribonuclease D [Gammaproteobacteria bacterium]